MASRAILFDLDGTVVDSKTSIRDTLQHVLVEYGHEPLTADEFAHLVGVPLRDILRLRSHDAGRIDAMADLYRRHYMAEGWRGVVFFDGMRELVESLRADGHHVAVVTTKWEPEALSLLDDLDAGDLFDTVVGDDDVRPLKPDPAPVVAACGRLGLQPRSAAMVGDTPFDIAAGVTAGAWTAGVTWGTSNAASLAAAGAHAISTTPTELAAALRGWSG